MFVMFAPEDEDEDADADEDEAEDEDAYSALRALVPNIN